MKKTKDQSVFMLVIIILIIALGVNVAGIIMHWRNARSYTYSSYKTTFETSSNAKSATVYATLKDSDRRFKDGLGPRDVVLNYGKNIIDIGIESKNKTFKTYTLIVDKKDDRSDENRLEQLYVSNATIDFDSNQDSYNVSIGCDINEISINGLLKDTSSYFSINYEPRKIKLSDGLNVAFLKVKSQAGSEHQYKINIFKNSNDNNCNKDVGSKELASLSLSKAKLTFDSSKNKYEVSVPYEIDDLNVYAFAKDNEASVNIEKPDKLAVGNNTITVRVTSVNEEVNEYTIVVNRKKAVDEEIDLKLEKLEVSGFNIHFNSAKTNYEISSDPNKNMIISAYPYSDAAKVTIQETSQKNHIKNIQILVSSGDKTKKYNIRIQKGFWNMKNEIIAVCLMFIVGLGIMAVIKHFEKRNKKKIIKKSNKKKQPTKKVENKSRNTRKSVKKTTKNK